MYSLRDISKAVPVGAGAVLTFDIFSRIDYNMFNKGAGR